MDAAISIVALSVIIQTCSPACTRKQTLTALNAPGEYSGSKGILRVPHPFSVFWRATARPELVEGPGILTFTFSTGLPITQTFQRRPVLPRARPPSLQ